MATLHVRSVPEGVYDRVRTLAYSRRRSLSAEVVELLERALEIENQQQQQERAIGVNLAQTIYPSPDAKDSVELLREDRADE